MKKLLFGVLLLVSSLTATDVGICQTLSVTDNYTLNQSVGVNGSDCMTISAANTVFDCSGYSITGNSTDWYKGIFVTASNVTVKNCVVQQYAIDVQVGDYDAAVSNITVTNNTLINTSVIWEFGPSGSVGLRSYIDNSLVQGNNISGDVEVNYDTYARQNNVIDGNVINYGHITIAGVDVNTRTSNNNVTNNNITSPTNNCIYFESVQDTTISNNICTCGYDYSCFEFAISRRLNIKNNQITTTAVSCHAVLFADLNGNYNDNVTFTNNTINASDTGCIAISATYASSVSSLKNSSFVANNITAPIWTDIDDPSIISFNNSTAGNIYYFTNGSGAWEVYNIGDTNGDYWADEGADLPFNSTTVSSYWTGYGNDWHPYTTNSTGGGGGANNTAPTITAISVVPNSPNKSANISCNITAVDNENATFNITYEWYKNGVFQGDLDGTFNTFENNSTVLISNLTPGNFSQLQNWSCRVRAYDGVDYSSWNMSTNVTIVNFIPTVPEPLTPQNNSYLYIPTANFSWNASIDSDSDNITYTVWFGTTLPPNTDIYTNDTYMVQDLYPPSIYVWVVQACDPYECSANSSTQYVNVVNNESVGSITSLPSTFTYGSNLGCSFIPVSFSSATANVTYWIERGDGTIPSGGLHILTDIATNTTYTDSNALVASLTLPNEIWRCGVNMTVGVYSASAYTDFKPLVQVSGGSGGGSGSYTPPSPLTPIKTANETVKKLYLPEKVGAYGFTLSTSVLRTGIAGQFMLGHLILIGLFFILGYTWTFNTGILRYVKVFMIVFFVLAVLVIWPVVSAIPK